MHDAFSREREWGVMHFNLYHQPVPSPGGRGLGRGRNLSATPSLIYSPQTPGCALPARSLEQDVSSPVRPPSPTSPRYSRTATSYNLVRGTMHPDVGHRLSARHVAAIEFNDQTPLHADKIDDVAAYGFLPFEFNTHKVMRSQVIPQPLFGYCWVTAHGFGVMQHSSLYLSIFTNKPSPLPHPSPASGRGGCSPGAWYTPCIDESARRSNPLPAHRERVLVEGTLEGSAFVNLKKSIEPPRTSRAPRKASNSTQPPFHRLCE